MADVEKTGSNVKGNISKGIRYNYNANFKTVVIKSAEQTTVK
jgi:hypothetical protein